MQRIINSKGITLISLVITIIVLLILAGVSINALTGEKSIINQAKDAKSAHEIAQLKEELELLAVKAISNGATTGEDMATYVENNLSGAEIYKTEATYVRFEYNEEDIVLHDDGDVTIIEKVYTEDAGGANLVSGEVNLINSVVENDTLVVPNYYKANDYKLTNIISTSQYELYNANITAKKIIVSEGIEKIGGIGIFAYMNAEEIYLPSTLLEIGDYAFHGNNITEIVIPKSVEKMGLEVFASCPNLKKIYCETELPEGKTVPEGWEENWNITSAEVIWGYGQ